MNPEAVRAAERVPHGGSDDPDVLDFSANTNPETPPGVESVYREALAAATRYPPDDYPEYRGAAAEYVDCTPTRVVPTPGGLAGLRLAIATRVRPGDRVAVPAPSFGEYAREVRLQGGEPVVRPAESILETDPAAFRSVVVCHPNNPTGRAYPTDALRAFAARCREADCELLVDEAFLGFTDRPSLAGTAGVVVARSLTKLFGLPGIRAGFLVAAGERLEELRTARSAWNLSAPAAAVGRHAMRADGFVSETRERVARERARLRDALAQFGTVHPSTAPFLLVEPDVDVDRLLGAVADRGIALRDARTFRGLDDHVRIAVRTEADHDRLLEVLEDVHDSA